MRALPSAVASMAPVLAVALLLASGGSAAAQADRPAEGVIIPVPSPITPAVITQINQNVESVRNDRSRNVRKVVFDFNLGGKDAATDRFGVCYDLASLIKGLSRNGITTIAYVHGKVTRHTVLPVLACDDLVMQTNSRLGEVWSRDRPVEQGEIKFYEEFAGIIRAGPVLKMIDKDVRLIQAKYRDTFIYVDARKLEGRTKDEAYAGVVPVNQTPVPMTPGVELYTVESAIKFNLCKKEVDNADDLRQYYQLGANADITNPLGGKEPKGVRIRVEGKVDTALNESIRRQIQTAKARGENIFFFAIETTANGSLEAAEQIARQIIELRTNADYKARTIAFIPAAAPDVSTLIAFACREIVMYKGPDVSQQAFLGNFSDMLKAGTNRTVTEPLLQKNLGDVAKSSGIPSVVVDGLISDAVGLVVARNNQTGERRVMTEDELNAGMDKGWATERQLKAKGKPFVLNASVANDLRIATTIDNKDISEVYARYGLDATGVRSAEPSLLDHIGAFLRRGEVSILLVIIGIAGLILELKAPGLVVPGVISAVCFVLFFWAQTQLGGELIYLAIMLFILGLALLGIEIFLIPGFGVAGVSGILLILAGLVLAGLDKAPESSADWFDLVGRMLRYGLTMAGAGVLAFIVSRYLPKIPYANRLMLVPPEDKSEAGEEASPLPGVDVAVAMLGQVGTATSMLRPAGMAKFGDRYIDVVTEGDFFAPGTPIQVVEVEGTRIVVKRV